MAEIDISQALDYIIAVFPLAVAHLALPPISFFGAQPLVDADTPPQELLPLFQAIYNIIPQTFFDPAFINSLLLDKKSQYEFCSQLITHIFIHRDYHHLLSNLQGTIILGYPVFVEKGGFFFHAVYLFGGLFATLPLDNYLPASAPKQQTNRSSWSNLITDPLTKYANRLIQALGLDRKVLCCGSSGAVCSLLGVNFIFAGKHFFTNLWELKKLLTNQSSYHTTSGRHVMKSSHEFSRVRMGRLIYSILGNGCTLYMASHFLVEEWKGANNQRTSDGSSIRSGPITSVTSLLRLITPSDSINHMAHIQGFGFGACAAVASLFYSSLSP